MGVAENNQMITTNMKTCAIGSGRGTARVFIYPRLPFLGDIKELRVGLDGSGVFPGWHLRVAEVEHIKSGATWRFHCHGWIDKRGGWQRVLYPEQSVLLPQTV